MPKFRVEAKKQVSRDLKKLPKTTLSQIEKAVAELANDPFLRDKKVKPIKS